MPEETGSNIAGVIGQIPCGLFVLTSAFDGLRSGALTRWVQPCSITPPLLMVAVANGLPVEPLIRDSRFFALCQVRAGDKLLERKFATPPDRAEDPFVTLPSHCAPHGSPILDRAMSYVECEVVRHVDLDTDHRLYVGQVHFAKVLHAGCEPAVEYGGNGMLPIVNGTAMQRAELREEK